MKKSNTISNLSLNKAVFFDRDGTINSDEGHYYIYKPEDFVFNPGVIEGMKRLQTAGYLLFVITNQGGIAKGIYTREDDDVTEISDAAPMDEVVFIGRSSFTQDDQTFSDEIKAEELALQGQTISNEILSCLGERLDRVVL